MPLFARGSEDGARCLVHMGDAAPPDLPGDGIVMRLCRRRGPVQAFLDAPLRDVDAAGLFEGIRSRDRIFQDLLGATS